MPVVSAILIVGCAASWLLRWTQVVVLPQAAWQPVFGTNAHPLAVVLHPFAAPDPMFGIVALAIGVYAGAVVERTRGRVAVLGGFVAGTVTAGLLFVALAGYAPEWATIALAGPAGAAGWWCGFAGATQRQNLARTQHETPQHEAPQHQRPQHVAPWQVGVIGAVVAFAFGGEGSTAAVLAAGAAGLLGSVWAHWAGRARTRSVSARAHRSE